MKSFDQNGAAPEMLSPRSLIVRMDLSERCNLRCTMCHFRNGAGSYDMPPAVLDRIVQEIFPNAHTVHLSCGTEPMMSRHFGEAVERARAARVPAIRLISNGTLLNDKQAELLVDNDVDLIVISLDGATQATYEKIRVGAHWEKVIANIRRLQKLKQARGTKRPQVMLAFVVQRSNLDQVPAFLDLAHELGVTQVQFQELVILFPDLAREALDDVEIQRQADAWMDEARRKAEDYGITLYTVPLYFDSKHRARFKTRWKQAQRAFATAVRNLRQRSLVGNRIELRYRAADLKSKLFPRRYTQRCFEPWRTVIIHPNGEIVPCSLWQGESLGNLQTASFASIWDNEEYRRLRAELKNGNLRAGCRACPAYSGDHRYRIN